MITPRQPTPVKYDEVISTSGFSQISIPEKIGDEKKNLESIIS
jgi:hypothetical protein